jgi:hypothetical protein
VRLPPDSVIPELLNPEGAFPVNTGIVPDCAAEVREKTAREKMEKTRRLSIILLSFHCGIAH